MKGSQLFGVALAIFSLILLYAPLDQISIPTPIPPDTKQLAAELSSLMPSNGAAGPNDVNGDAEVLEGIIRSAANILVLDTQRKTPFYDDNENFKWVVRNIGDITYPDGWVMEQRYPQLRNFLAQRMETRLQKDFSRQQLVTELRLIADAFGAI